MASKIPGSYLSSGSSLLNLSCTDDVRWAFRPGRMYLFVGDSSSGKTWLSLSILAEAANREFYNDYLLIHDDVENGRGMDVEEYFGKKLASRIQGPKGAGHDTNSVTVQDFYRNLFQLQKDGKKFVYVLDSQDALDSEESKEKFEEQAKAAAAGKKAAGSYGDAKAKVHSQNLRRAIGQLKDTESILIIINQTRDDLKSTFGGKTASGGKAMFFYAWMSIWTRVKSKIKKTSKGEERTIGIEAASQLRKNRETGKIGGDREVSIPIYYSHGVDDTGSMVDYLVAKKVITKSGLKLDGSPLGLEVSARDKLISDIEEKGLERKLASLCHRHWNEVEDSVSVKRRKRYE